MEGYPSPRGAVFGHEHIDHASDICFDTRASFHRLLIYAHFACHAYRKGFEDILYGYLGLVKP